MTEVKAWMIKAKIRGALGLVISEKEYYYLMFGCVDQKCIDAIKRRGASP